MTTTTVSSCTTRFAASAFGIAPSNGQSQQMAKQISNVNDCTAQANAAMNAGPSAALTYQNVIDGVVAATFNVATDGAATALGVLTNFFKGTAIRSAGHAAQNGITFLTTYHGCLAAAGQVVPTICIRVSVGRLLHIHQQRVPDGLELSAATSGERGEHHERI